MERFRKCDIEFYKGSEHSLGFLPCCDIDIVHVDAEVGHIDIPRRLFSHLIRTHRPALIKYFPYQVGLYKLDRGNNIWLQKTKYLGLNDGDVLKLYLDHEHDHSVVSLLWILLHEFRHKVQFHDPCIMSNINNNNVKQWKAHYGVDIDVVNHVFHEIDPQEVDANVFASEILNIPYPGSKFNITSATLGLLDRPQA
jgi:hypothetical protein